MSLKLISHEIYANYLPSDDFYWFLNTFDRNLVTDRFQVIVILKRREKAKVREKESQRRHRHGN